MSFRMYRKPQRSKHAAHRGTFWELLGYMVHNLPEESVEEMQDFLE